MLSEEIDVSEQGSNSYPILRLLSTVSLVSLERKRSVSVTFDEVRLSRCQEPYITTRCNCFVWDKTVPAYIWSLLAYKKRFHLTGDNRNAKSC